MDLLSTTDMNNEDQKLIYEKSIKYALNSAKKANYGTSDFADNLPGSSYVFLPIEQQHQNLSKGVISDSLSTYVYNNITNIISDENNELYNEVVNQFSFGGNVEVPTHAEIKELIEQGNIYVTAVQNGLTGSDTMYEVHIANSGSKFDEPYGYDTLNHLTFDGAYFNPTVYTFDGILTKQFVKDLVDGNIIMNDKTQTFEFPSPIGTLILPNVAVDSDVFNSFQQRFYGPIKRAIEIGGNIDVIHSKLINDLYTGIDVDFREVGK